MGVRRLGIVMNGVTGRMGTNQHLVRSIVAIRAEGGVTLSNGDRVMPDPILVGRNAGKLAALAQANGITRIATDLDAALADPNDTVFFDAATTQMRPALLAKAMAAGKHIYCEKPVATNLEEALGIVRKAKAAGIRHGVVQDKLFLPGLRKLKLLIDSGFFGRIFAVKGEFGYWVFEGDLQPAQRPSWNYRAEDGGGMILDMLCHWRYVLDNTFGNVRSVSCLGRQPYPRAHRRGRQALQGHRRRRRLRHLPARGRHHRPLQLLVGDARAPRRPAHAARRRHARLGGGGAAGRRHPAAHGDAEARLEPRRASSPSTSTPAGSRCRRRRPSTTASSCSGRPSSATSSRARPTSGTSPKAPRACSWWNARCAAGRSAAGWTCRT